MTPNTSTMPAVSAPWLILPGRKSHKIVAYGKQVLLNLQHRGAAGADESTGDGAGILLQIPHEFLAGEADRLRFELAAQRTLRRRHALPAARRRPSAARAKRSWPRRSRPKGLNVLGWRDVPATIARLGDLARSAEPVIRQVFIGGNGLVDEELERRLFRRAEADRTPRAGRTWASRRRLLHPVDVVPHDLLQGHVPRAAVVRLLSRPGRPAT